jgi:hypothetical protein
MRNFPIRAEIYNPSVIIGVRDSDLKYVIILTIAALIIPVIFDWFIGAVPVSAIAVPVTLAGSILFFNWARIGKRNRFLEYKIKSWQATGVYRKRRAREFHNDSYLIF